MNENIYVGYDRVIAKIENSCLYGWEEVKTIDQLKAAADERTPNYTTYVKWVGAKIPKKLMQQLLGTIHQFPRTETGFVLYYNSLKREWAVKCPEQSGCGASVAFKDNGVPPEPGFATIGTLHTHPEMKAFWSGTDSDDQVGKFGVHFVFGLKDGHVKHTLCTVFTQAGQYDQQLSDMIEPVDFDADYAPNPEWVEKIKANRGNAVFSQAEKEARARDVRRRRSRMSE